MYELGCWEVELDRRREAQNQAEPETIGRGRQLSWPSLAREISGLNAKYFIVSVSPLKTISAISLTDLDGSQ